MKRPLLILGGIFLIVLGLGTPVATTIATFILPETFASSTMIVHRTGSPPPFAALVERITSQSGLDPVIKDLNLGEQWGRKYKQPGGLSSGQCFVILKGNIKVSQAAKSGVVYIGFTSDNKDEAALIANKLGTVYCQTTPGAVIMAAAQPNPRPVPPNKPRNILLGIFVGIVFVALGVGLLLAAKKAR